MPEGATAVGANTSPVDVTLGTPATSGELTSPVNDGFSRIDPAVDNVSDVDGIPVKAVPTTPAKAPADATKATPAPDKKADDVDPNRLDQNPRFKELLSQRDAFKEELARIKGQLEVLTPSQKQAAEKKEAAQLPYKDITKMTKQELVEWQEDDPVGYAANLYQQMLHEARTTLTKEKAEQSHSDAVKATYMDYAKQNPAFMKDWQAGKIQQFMDAHPGHNAMSAHMMMTLPGAFKTYHEKAVKDAVDKAVKETEDRVTKNFQAKKHAEVERETGRVTPATDVPDEIKNPDKYGGTTAALASRLTRMRQVGAGG